jgi:glycosyltransferase involved in cell wall biosynthesis
VRRFYRDIIDEHVLAALKTDLPRSAGGLAGKLQKRIRELGWRIPLKVVQRLRENLKEKIAKRIDQAVVPHIDLIVSNSKFIAGVVKKVFGLNAVPCLLGVPLERFGSKNKNVRYDNFTLTVSRLMYEKNLFNLIRAIKLLVDKGSFKAREHIIAGGGPLLDQLRDFVREQRLEKVVNLKGFVSEQELSDLYRRAKLVIYLTLDETYGLPFPEAGLYKKAVIGPNHGGPSELVVHGKTGFQVDALDPSDIALHIERILAHQARLKKMGENNYRHVTRTLDFVGFVDRFMNIVESNFANRH